MSKPKEWNPPSGRDGEGLTGKIGRAGSATGRLALRPVRAAAHAGRDALSDEAERAIDGVMAGPLPEAIGRSLVEHQVVRRLAVSALETSAAKAAPTAPPLDLVPIEKLVRRALDDPALQRMLVDTIHARLTGELTDQLVQSPAFRRMLASVLSSPELRGALERQATGFTAEMAAAVRRRARKADDAIEARVRGLLRRPRADPSPTRYAGVATRGTALVADAILATLGFLVGGALISLVASLFGTLRPAWLVGALAGVGWSLVVLAYFVGFWSTIGQTPGMRLMRLHVIDATGRVPSAGRSLVRLVGLALAIIPMFAGFLPALVDERRRALPDFLAGTTVVYEPDEPEQPVGWS